MLEENACKGEWQWHKTETKQKTKQKRMRRLAHTHEQCDKRERNRSWSWFDFPIWYIHIGNLCWSAEIKHSQTLVGPFTFRFSPYTMRLCAICRLWFSLLCAIRLFFYLSLSPLLVYSSFVSDGRRRERKVFVFVLWWLKFFRCKTIIAIATGSASAGAAGTSDNFTICEHACPNAHKFMWTGTHTDTAIN